MYNDDRVVAVRGVADAEVGRFGVGAVSVSGVRSASSASSSMFDADVSRSSSVDRSRFCAGAGGKSSDADESRPKDVLARG